MKFETYIGDPSYFFHIYKDWCEKHNFPPLHRENVEEIAVCFNGRTPIYCLFFWNTNSKMCMIGFPVSNPDIGMKVKEGGLDFLIKDVCKHAEKWGYNLLWTTSATDRVIDVLKNNNFVKGDEFVHQYIKILC